MDKSDGQSINGKGLAFPGITPSIDCPFKVSNGIPLGSGLKEASALLNAAWETVRRIAQESDNAELAGSAFLIQAADSVVLSLSRGFESHPLASGDDGYHA